MKYLIINLFFISSSFSLSKQYISDEDQLIYKYSSNIDLKKNVVVDIDKANQALRNFKNLLTQNSEDEEKKKSTSKVVEKVSYQNSESLKPMTAQLNLSVGIIGEKRATQKVDYFSINYLDNEERVDSINNEVIIKESINASYAEREFEVLHFDGMRTISRAFLEKNKKTQMYIPLFDKIDFYSQVINNESEFDSAYLMLKKKKGLITKLKINKEAKKLYFNENFKKINSFKKASFVLIITKRGLLKTKINVKSDVIKKSYFLKSDTIYYDEVSLKKTSINYKVKKGYHFKQWGDKKISYKRDRYTQRIDRKFQFKNQKNYLGLVKKNKIFKVSSSKNYIPTPDARNIIKILDDSNIDAKNCVSQINLSRNIDFLEYEFDREDSANDLDLYSITKGKLARDIIEGSHRIFFANFRDYIVNLNISYKDGSKDFLRIVCDSSVLVESI